MKIIGITGGVGSGKSRVLSYIEETFPCTICQADHVAWELQKPGEIAYREIVKHFGEGILNADGCICRPELGKIVFADAAELQALNAIMHPEVGMKIDRLMYESRKSGADIFVLEAALLLEENYNEFCDEVWYIKTDEKIRRQRLKESRNYSDDKIDSIISSQLPESVFLKRCTRIIDNNGSFEETCEQVTKIMAQLGVN